MGRDFRHPFHARLPILSDRDRGCWPVAGAVAGQRVPCWGEPSRRVILRFEDYCSGSTGEESPVSGRGEGFPTRAKVKKSFVHKGIKVHFKRLTSWRRARVAALCCLPVAIDPCWRTGTACFTPLDS